MPARRASRPAPPARRPAPPAPPPPAFAGRAELRAVWADRAIRRLAGVAFLGFGVFVALTTWLQALLEPAGIDDETAGWLLAAMVVAGVIGSALLPAPLARHRAERAFLRTAAIVAAAGCVTLALAPSAAWIAVVPLGVVLLGSLPVILELTERRSPTGAATALIWLAGQRRWDRCCSGRAGRSGPAGRGVRAARGDGRVRPRAGLKEAAAAPRTPTA